MSYIRRPRMMGRGGRTFDVLLIGGGKGGGDGFAEPYPGAADGGDGAIPWIGQISLAAGTWPAVIGAKGLGQSDGDDGLAGGNSTFAGLTAPGATTGGLGFSSGAAGIGGDGASADHSGKNGGVGVTSSISGSAKVYGSGGAGVDAGGSVGTRGSEANTANQGGGGDAGQAGGSDGQKGVLVVRYLTADGLCTGGTITTDGSHTVHTFTSSGDFTVP